jgi:hypothetical protein
MFVHPEITSIKWCPTAPEPKYILCGNPQAVYLMIRRRLLTQLQYVLNRMINQLDFLFIPASTTPRIITTPLLAGFPTAATTVGTTLALDPLVVPPPVDRSLDADHDTGISNSSISSDLSATTQSSSQQDFPSPTRQYVTTETQTEDQVTHLTFMTDSPWAWLEN